jgi:hypothetical protein
MEYFTLREQQICISGHFIQPNRRTVTQKYAFCPDCGDEVINKCQCNAPLTVRGYSERQGNYVVDKYLPIPKYCWACGKPLPWTEQIINATHELVEELEELSDQERKLITDNIEDFIDENPRTVLAATRIKKVILRAKDQAQIALKSFMIDVASKIAEDVLTGRVNF